MPIPSRSSRLLVTVLVAVPWLIVGIQWFLVLPRFARLFDQFGLALPFVSHCVVTAVKWAGEMLFVSGWVFFMCLILSMLGVFRLMSADLPSKTRNLRLLMVFAVPLLLFAMSWVGIAVPYSKLMEGLGK